MKFDLTGQPSKIRVPKVGDVAKIHTNPGNTYLVLFVEGGFIVLKVLVNVTKVLAWKEWSLNEDKDLGSHCRIEFCDDATLVGF